MKYSFKNYTPKLRGKELEKKLNEDKGFEECYWMFVDQPTIFQLIYDFLFGFFGAVISFLFLSTIFVWSFALLLKGLKFLFIGELC